MSMDEFIPSITPDVRETILSKLRGIERDENVKILFAIESGSRAWGFPSPDSDYDVRFIYARPTDWYMTLTPGRDVVELPIEGDWDINGWDIKKALNLLLKPNPVMLEWLSSPIRYMWDEAACAKLTAFSEKIAHGPACINHYLNLGARQWGVYIDGKSDVNLKKYFYIVRPAMAIRWMRMHPEVIPPMNFQALLKGIDFDATLTGALNDLLLAKSKSKEIGQAPRVDVIDAFITSEFDWARERVKTIKGRPQKLRDEADALFRDIVMS
ncbi:MAG: nucleotidyltransferase domain-containing protein [Maricaulaceae bacterium]